MVSAVTIVPAARLERLSKRYPDGTVALVDVTLEVGAAERILVTGPPGSGTSTLLRILAGRSIPTGGRADVLGVPTHLADPVGLRRLRRQVGLLEGVPALAEQASVAEAMHFGSDRPATGLVADLAGALPVGRQVGDLEAAERSLLALVLVGLRRPRLVVADDPWRHLDPGEGLAVGRLACRVARELGAAFILSGRDAGAFDGVDRAIRLRDGRVVA